METLFQSPEERSRGNPSLSLMCSMTQMPMMLINTFWRAVGRVSFTTDLWSSKSRHPYLAITTHWIAKVEGSTSLQLKASLIAFHRLRGGHDGVSLAKTVLSLLDRAGVTVKVAFLINGPWIY
jgi:hypothetical protein